MVVWLRNSQLANIVWFQVGWWALVLTAAGGYTLWGLVIAPLFLLIHFYLISASWLRDIKLLIPCALIGIIGDTSLISTQWLSYPSSAGYPYWLGGLWFLFPLTLPYSFSHLFNRISTWPLLAVGAALSYSAGVPLKVLELPATYWMTIGVITCLWLCYFILFYFVLKWANTKP
jgi:hypothetical protein